jgi:two-component system response regulator BaeR
LRRAIPQPCPPATQLLLDEQAFQLRHATTVVQLTAVEFRLIQAMQRTPGRILNRQQLIDQIYLDGRVVSERTVDSHIKKLRRKLELLSCAEQIEAVYGLGYRLVPCGAVA